MRDELHLLELADRYLEGAMSVEERDAFEVRMVASQELRGVVSDQRALREGLERIPVRSAAAKAYAAYRFGKWWPWAVGGLAVIGIGAGLWLSGQHGSMQDPHMVSTGVEVSTLVVDTLVATAYPDPPMDESGSVLPGPGVGIDTILDTVYVATLNGKRVSWDSIPKGAMVKQVREMPIGHDPAPVEQGDMRTLTKDEIALRLDSVTAIGQPASTPSTTTEPMFKGGWDAMHRYLQQNIRPIKESKEGGTVIVDFLVDELGRISDVQVKESLSEAHDKEAVRVIKGMPKWLPCKTNGLPARCRMTVPLRFAVSDKR